jgi:hypothetical protein
LSRGGGPPSTGVIPSPSQGARVLVGYCIPSFVRVPPVHSPQAMAPSGPPRLDPDGLAEPPPFLGGRQYPGYIGSSPLHGGGPTHHGGSSQRAHHFSFPSSQSMADQWCVYTFPGGTLPLHGGSSPAAASVALTLPLVALLLRPLPHEDLSGSSASDLTMSF